MVEELITMQKEHWEEHIQKTNWEMKKNINKKNKLFLHKSCLLAKGEITFLGSFFVFLLFASWQIKTYSINRKCECLLMFLQLMKKLIVKGFWFLIYGVQFGVLLMCPPFYVLAKNYP